MYYVVVAAGAAFFAYLAPFIWKNVFSINFLGPTVQGSLVAGIGAVLGIVLADALGFKSGGRR